MARHKTTQALDDDHLDLIFIFKKMDIKCLCDPDIYDKESAEELQDAVTQLSEEIVIDKSYVDFPENKHQKTFISLEAWDSLCALALVEHYIENGKVSKSQKQLMRDSYQLMAVCYIEQCLEDLGYDVSGICLMLKDGSKYRYEIRVDTTHAWKDYKGPWQTW